MDIIYYFQHNFTITLTMIGVLGLIVGSFINVVIYRLPIMLNRAWQEEIKSLTSKITPLSWKRFDLCQPSSHCPNCKKALKFWHNIPVLSYLILRGKCRFCRRPISLCYPTVEILSAAVAMLAFWKFGFTWQTPAAIALSWALIIISAIDINHQIIPDDISIPCLWLGLLISLNKVFISSSAAIYGAIFGYLSLWLVALAFKTVRKCDGMGHGDFKLLAMLGAWLGWQQLPLIILIASLLGSIIGIIIIITSKKHHRNTPIPFGPFLAFAGWVVLFWGNNLTTMYLNMVGW